jgi:hypothetical protein
VIRRRPRRGRFGCSILFPLLVLAACADASTAGKSSAEAVEPLPTPSTTATSAPVTSTTGPGPRFTLEPYRGLGTWVDVFDWTVHYDRTPEDPPAVGTDELSEMAALGVRTVYFQPTRYDAPVPGLVEVARARLLIDRAHELGMAVVGWYLPTFEDPAADRARIDAVLELPLDGFGLDIESVLLADEAERGRRAVQLAADLRADLPGEVLGAIVLPPVVTEVYGTYWGTFPWDALAPSVDVWLTMGYWTNRTVESGWRDAAVYTGTNVDLLREATGDADAVVHPVGGVACCEGPTAPTTVADVEAFLEAARERGAVGASLYDFVTMPEELWEPMATANDL